MPRREMTGPEQTNCSMVDRLWGKRAELLWGLAAAVVLLSTVDTVLSLGLMVAIATVIAAWLGFRELLQRADRDDAAQPATPPCAACVGRPTRARGDLNAQAVARPSRRLRSGSDVTARPRGLSLPRGPRRVLCHHRAGGAQAAAAR